MAGPWAEIKQQDCFENEFVVVDNNGEIINETFTELDNSENGAWINSDEKFGRLLQMEFDEEYQPPKKESYSYNDENPFLEYDSENSQDLTDADDSESLDDLETSYRQCRFTKRHSKLSDRASNDIKILSHHKQDHSHDVSSKKKLAMAERRRNQFIEFLLDKTVQISGVIDYGRDAITFHAYSFPKEYLVKVHKSVWMKFDHWEKYMGHDHYFKDKVKKQITSKAFQRNCKRQRDVSMTLLKVYRIYCPEVVTIKNGILVTTFIGNNKKPAPCLKEATFTKEEGMEAFAYIIRFLGVMYDANIVHGGLSEHNIFWHNEKVYIIDFSHCIYVSHPDAFNYLLRDLTNIIRFFLNRQPCYLRSPLKYFKDIVGFDFNDKKALERIRKMVKTKNKIKKKK